MWPELCLRVVASPESTLVCSTSIVLSDTQTIFICSLKCVAFFLLVSLCVFILLLSRHFSFWFTHTTNFICVNQMLEPNLWSLSHACTTRASTAMGIFSGTLIFIHPKPSNELWSVDRCIYIFYPRMYSLLRQLYCRTRQKEFIIRIKIKFINNHRSNVRLVFFFVLFVERAWNLHF